MPNDGPRRDVQGHSQQDVLIWYQDRFYQRKLIAEFERRYTYVAPGILLSYFMYHAYNSTIVY